MDKQPHEVAYRFESDAFSVQFSFRLKETQPHLVSSETVTTRTKRGDEPETDPPGTKAGLDFNRKDPTE